MSKSPQYPIEPLFAYAAAKAELQPCRDSECGLSQHYHPADFKRDIGPKAWRYLKVGHVGPWQADECAVQLGTLPFLIWPEWHDWVPSDNAIRVADYRNRQTALRNATADDMVAP